MHAGAQMASWRGSAPGDAVRGQDSDDHEPIVGNRAFAVPSPKGPESTLENLNLAV